MNKDKILDPIRRVWNENPIAVLAAGGFAATAIAKLISANTERKNAQTYRREVDRRIMMKNR